MAPKNPSSFNKKTSTPKKVSPPKPKAPTPVRDRLAAKVQARTAAKAAPARTAPSRTGTSKPAAPLLLHSQPPSAAMSTKSVSRAVDGKALARALAPIAHREAKKATKKKRGDSGFMKFLKGAGRTALEIAPAILPFLLGDKGHAPTQMAVKASGAPQADMVGLASAASLQPFAHVSGFKGSDRGGQNYSMSFQGLEYIGEVENSEWFSGDLIESFDLNPTGPRFSGTKLALYALMYEMFEFEEFEIIYQPTCAATVSGALGHYIDVDPTDLVDTQNTSPYSRIQKASQHMGYDTCQVWATGICQRVADKKCPPLFCDANGSDARLISAGRYNLLCTTDITSIADGGPPAVGALYVLYKARFSVPQMDDSLDLNGQGVTFYGTATTTNDGTGTNMFGLMDPFGTGNYQPAVTAIGPLNSVFDCEYAPTGSYWADKLQADYSFSDGTYFRCLSEGIYLALATCDNNKHNNPVSFWAVSDYGVSVDGLPGLAWGSEAVNANSDECCQDIDSYAYGLGRCAVVAVFTVTETYAGNDDTGTLFICPVGNDTAVGADCSCSITFIKLASVPDNTANKNSTLQEYEAKISDQNDRIARLERLVLATNIESPLTPATPVDVRAKEFLLRNARARAAAEPPANRKDSSKAKQKVPPPPETAADAARV